MSFGIPRRFPDQVNQRRKDESKRPVSPFSQCLQTFRIEYAKEYCLSSTNLYTSTESYRSIIKLASDDQVAFGKLVDFVKQGDIRFNDAVLTVLKLSREELAGDSRCLGEKKISELLIEHIEKTSSHNSSSNNSLSSEPKSVDTV